MNLQSVGDRSLSRWLGFGALGLVLAFTAWAAETADPTPILVRLDLVGGGADPVPVVVEVSAQGGEEDSVRGEATAPGRVSLTPPGEPPWTLRAAAEGFWSEPRVITAPGDESPRIVLWPEVRLQGEVRVPDGFELPQGIAVRLQKAEGRSRLGATVLCPLDDEGELDCALPGAPGLDLRLRTPGFASRFYWDLDLSEKEGHDLGTVVLRPGASVVGRVEVPAGHTLEGVSVGLLPTRGVPASDSEDERISAQVAGKIGVDERGFFAFEGLSAGAYRLEVSHPGLANYALDPVRVVDGAQTEVTDTIVLSEPIPFRLILDPQFDPYGRDWKVQLYRRLPSGQKVRVFPDRELVVEAGSLEVSTAPGSYELRVLDSRDVRLATEEVVVGTAGAPLVLSIEPILVDGEVTLGDEPILARITFRGESTWTMDADFEGRFSGYLPRDGDWDVAVEAFEPPVERRTRALPVEVDEEEGRAFLKLRLPDTTLEGTVVDEAGTLVADADVTLVDPLLTEREVTVTTDRDGEFEVRALDEGEVQAQAVFRDEAGTLWSSQQQVARLEEGETAEVRLVLRAHEELRGRIVAADGNPVPRAWIEVSPFDAAGLLDVPAAQPFSSDATGRFAISLPASIETVHLTVMSPGYPLTQRVVPLGDLGDLILPSGAGALVLDLPGRIDEFPWTDPTRPRLALVDSQGIKFPIGPLAQWSSMNGQPWQRDAGEVTLPQLAPGRYAVCWLSAQDWLVRAATGTDCVAAEFRAGGTTRVQIQEP